MTDAEAQVIGALLASMRVTERSRLQRAGVPRSTYHAARRRAYAEGWLRDRYIPNPVEYGLPFASIGLARPFADRLDRFVEERKADPATVVLAHSPQVVLSIGWHETEASARSAAESPGRQGFASWSFAMVANLAQPTLPVYFDFEGTFAHVGGRSAPDGYPQGLGGAPGSDRPPPGTPVERRTSWAVTELVHRPFGDDGNHRPPHLVGPLGLPWGQQRLLNQGWVSHRVLLDPAKLPPFRGRATAQQVFVVGSLRRGAQAPELFSVLTRECRVFPYLFAASENRVLLGALGQGTGGPPTDEEPRASVLRTISDRVEGIEIIQEPTPTFVLVVDHRYDRQFPRRGT